VQGQTSGDWHSLQLSTVLSRLNTDRQRGLSSNQVSTLTQEHGLNKLQESAAPSVFAMFVAQLKEFLILLLIGAAIISALAGETADAVVIVAVVLLSAVSGVIQELKAEKSIQALQKLSISKARVIRDGIEHLIDASELVPGDIILLEAGDRVPADARLIEAIDVRTDESLLTGESTPAEKRAEDSLSPDTALGDRVNMVYSSTTVLTGRAVAVVTSTGMSSEVGKIAEMIGGMEQEETPLQRKLGQLGKTLGIVAIGLCALIFLIGVLRGIRAFEMFMTAISLAVAAVPEGLPAIVTVVLAIGVQKMSKENAIIRRLSAVETLGSATMICSDKTGTLTQNKMTVRALVTAAGMIEADNGERTSPDGTTNGASVLDHEVQTLIEASVLCNNSALEPQDSTDEPYRVLGDPTEGALLLFAVSKGIDRERLLEDVPRIGEIPFDSDRKRMTTLHLRDGHLVAYVKGAFDSILDLISAYRMGGETLDFDEKAREFCVLANDNLASRGMRVLAVAMKHLDDLDPEQPVIDPGEIESSLVLIGLVAMIDPPRPEAKAAVHLCKQAGMTPVMITGDHKATATAIARELGILDDSAAALSGVELDSLDEQEFERNVKRYRVYARVSPNHKLRIVDALQRQGELVAMTGDGVNDAPALKKADIGVAMGITGTDVAKEAADMVLLDDNFATIVKAVQHGRVIFDNIRKSIYYLVSCNVGELVAIFIAIASGLARPLEAIQILWVNLVTDGPPALAMGVEKGDEDVMRRPPRDPGEGVFTRGGAITIAVYGLSIGFLTLLGYVIGWRYFGSGDVQVGRTMAFGVLVFSQLLHAFNIRSGTASVFRHRVTDNPTLLLALAGSAILQLAVMLYSPLMKVFKVQAMTASQWATVFGLALLIIPAAEMVKAVLRRYMRPEAEKEARTVL